MSFCHKLHKQISYETVKQNPLPNRRGLISDREIRFTSKNSIKHNRQNLRCIDYLDETTGNKYTFLTNIRHLAARTIADIYKERWQIELFFKWIKQNLKIKAFLGTSKNAVFTQVLIAMCANLMMAFQRFISGTKLSLQQCLRLVQMNLFHRRQLSDLLTEKQQQPPNIATKQLILQI